MTKEREDVVQLYKPFDECNGCKVREKLGGCGVVLYGNDITTCEVFYPPANSVGGNG